jgi:ribose transport system substrate-binding protein
MPDSRHPDESGIHFGPTRAGGCPSQEANVKANRSLAVAVLALAGTALAACSSSGTATSESSAPASAAAAASSSLDAESGAGKVMGIVQFSGSDVFSNAALAGAEEYAKAQGWEVKTVDAQGSVDQANAAITNLVTSGVTAIVTSVFPADALGAGAASAVEAGIPVANWGGGTSKDTPFAADVSLGDALAEQLVKDMGGKGEILTLGYRPGLPCQLREASLDKALQGTDIKQTKQQITIPGQVESASAATSAWAAARPAGSGPLAVWGCFDDPATGAASAVRDLGRDDIMVYGLNGTKAAVDLVKAGDMKATLWIDGPQQGAALAELLINYVADPSSATVPQLIGGKTVVVNKDSLDDFLASNPTLY